ncbi:Choline/Carnitine O-acyltransferase [Dictyocaulus viviparus]|uniref:Choline/Carnitine O-acyltransferase n=1 Tax=Dictyocaulus viviparus TaxID=29172 RepID=A0A0D8Y7T1_DICVI|nr:Choline/Carnitine O-acyltransferase [Dictyocaulus viviparus]
MGSRNNDSTSTIAMPYKARFLASAKVVLSDPVYARTHEAVRCFEKNEGPILQKALLEYDRSHKDTSFIYEPWYDVYLRSRLPCPVNFNPFMMYAPDPVNRYNHQLTRSTNLAISFARFKKALDSNILAPEVFHLNPMKSDTKLTLPPSLSWFGAVMFKAFPLDMSQYKSLFNGTRIPKRNRDILFQDSTQKHFMVLYRGRIYVVDIFDDNGDILPANDIHSSLAHILKHGEQQTNDKCIGSLTSLERDVWADVRDELLEAGNADKLHMIDSALFTLCLDDLKTTDPFRLVQSLLVGDDASNRWFDKSFQLIVDGNGQATINFEHSWGDGVAVLRLMEESYNNEIDHVSRDTNTHHFVTPDTDPKPANASMLKELDLYRLSTAFCKLGQ